MLVSLKIFLLAVIFVVTGGAVFTELFKKYRGLAVLAAIVAVLSSFYLGRSIYDDVVRDARVEVVASRGAVTEISPTRIVTPPEPRLPVMSAAEQYERGNDFRLGTGVEQSDAEAAKWYRLAADQGDADAQLNLGYMYLQGEGVEQSDAAALKWFRFSADRGVASAQTYLGALYYAGQGVEQSDTEAVKWYRLAAGQGYANAQSNLGYLYHKGIGVEQSDAEAVKWYRLAADQGHASAKRALEKLE